MTIKKGDRFTSKTGCSAVVIEYVNCKEVLIEFLDSHRHRVFVESGNLIAGRFKNPYRPNILGVGYIGVGNFKACVNGDDTYEYKTWRNMLKRCYCKKSKEKYPAYSNCTVHPDWHNFQVFAEWLSKNSFNGLGYHLDKDLLSSGNKVYSENTCSLVPLEINNLLVGSESSNGIMPIGVYYNEKANKYGSRIRINGDRKHLGFFDCQDKAHQAYANAKKDYVRSMAEKWRGKISENVFNALMNWKPEYEK